MSAAGGVVEGAERKPEIKNEGNPAGGGANCRGRFNNKNKFIKKEKFMRAHPDLQGLVFEPNPIRANQISNFTTVDTRIKVVVGQQFDPSVLESNDKMAATLPSEPTRIIAPGQTTMDEIEKIKYGKKYDRWLTKVEKIEQQIKQVYSIYIGQCDEDIKASLAEHSDSEVANQEKDLITLLKILQSANFSFQSNQEPILTIWNAKSDFIKLCQQSNQSVQEYNEKFVALCDVNETLGNNIHD